MQRRVFLRQPALWVATAAGAAVTGCAQPGAGGTESVSLPATPVDLRLPFQSTPTNDAYLAQVKAYLADKHNDKIRISQDPWADWGVMYEKFTAQAVAGDAPDLIWLCCQYVRPYFSTGQAQELESFVKRDWKSGQVEDFYKGMWDGMRLDNKQYAIPVYSNTPTIWYNPNLLKEAGLPAPSEDWNAAKFLDYATKLNRPDRDQWGFMMSNFSGINRNVLFIWAWGGEVNDQKDGPVITKLTYDDPKTIEALQFLHDLIWKHRVSPANDAARGGLGAQPAFEQGKAALYLDGSHVTGSFLRQEQTNSSFSWDIGTPVKGPKGYGARIGNDGYMIYKGSKHIEPAWTVIKDLYTPELQKARAEITASRPAIKSAQPHWEKQYPGKNMKVMRMLSEQARPDPQAYWKDSSQVSSIIDKYMKATFERNEMTVAEAMRKAMAEVRAFYASAPK